MSNELHVLFGVLATLRARRFEIRALSLFGNTNLFLYHSIFLLAQLRDFERMESHCVSFFSILQSILTIL